MTPSRDQLVDAYAFYARRMNLEERARRSPVKIELPLVARSKAIDAALVMSSKLVAENGIGEVSAVLYAFACHPKCFPFGLLGFTALLAMNVAASRGLRLTASRDDFRDVIMGVTENRLTPDEVSLWVDAHLTEV